jgi:hypothetical protein
MQILGVRGARPKRALCSTMSPGSHAFAATIVDIPASRSPHEPVPQRAESTLNPALACGLLA